MKTTAMIFLMGLVAAACAEPVAHHLVSTRSIDPPPLEEVRYATRYNFTGEVLYPLPSVWVHRDVKAALAKVQAALAKEGLGLKIFDGYRPLSVQQKMWDLVQDERYVSNPAKNRGRHTRGTAVDVTLVDKLGNPLPMPGPYDDFTEAAHRDSKAMTAEQRANMKKLEAVMAKHGFEPYPFEWWHFDFRDWKSYPVLDISFTDLAAGKELAEPVPGP
ncbi:M15 family metallopeptidase [Luteolibacter marinus]|uniref:M15 family metallopeptidase n=1 Tax=Luteolibacter marinus TaxID=2776705 RepID=UPI0018675480|nr:M15 family metallopeptidase [Luteolibacter marinus]